MDSRPLSLALLLVMAGCLGGTPATSPTADARPTTTESGATGSPATTTDSPLTPRPLPSRPENLTRTNVVAFVTAYERAYAWNRKLTNKTVDLTVNPVRAEISNETETGYVVHLEVGVSKTVLRDGGKMVGDGFYTVNYFVNETTIRRARAGGEVRPGPDPRTGTVLEPTTTAERTSEVQSTADQSSEVRVTKVSFGADLRNSGRDGVSTAARPIVRTNGSSLHVSGSIVGIGDADCIDVTATATRASNGTLTVVIRSGVSTPEGHACNATARRWPYDATLDVDGSLPETVHVRHVNSGEATGNWTVAVNRSA